MIDKYMIIFGLLVVVVSGAGGYLISSDPSFKTNISAAQQGQTTIPTPQKTAECSGPITATCTWDIKNLPLGTIIEDYYADLEVVDTASSYTVVGPIPSKIDKKIFSVRFDAEPGKRYACKVTIKLKDTSPYRFCYAEPVYYSEPVGLCE